ncbi:MAG: pseudouridine synthase [Rikenellaceae bacterium]
MIFNFKSDITNIELPIRLNSPFERTPPPIAVVAANELKEYINSRVEWSEEINRGKMFGVMVVKTPSGELGFIAAFSATLQGESSQLCFVPPIYDMLCQGGYFLTESQKITDINDKIDSISSNSEYIELSNRLSDHSQLVKLKLQQAKEQIKSAKSLRDKQRGEGSVTENQLIKESQYQKAQYKRLEKSLKEEYQAILERSEIFNQRLQQLKTQRKQMSVELQKWLFEQFVITNFRAEQQNLNQIFAATAQKTPPSGAGECAAPKLFHYAYANSLQPIAIAEFWWGASPKGGLRKHGNYYGACKGKCFPILSFMLKGLDVDTQHIAIPTAKPEILYDDNYIMVVNKPAGVLSVPGKIDSESLPQYLKRKFNFDPIVVNRLDMATSGVILIAKEEIAYKRLQQQFINRSVSKTYEALLCGELKRADGQINIPLSSDYNNRPCQKVDYIYGKSAITHFEIKESKDCYLNNQIIPATRVIFKPITGRTHQLRIHSAHPDGLATPIVGDNLYGVAQDRLYLHSKELIFKHPYSGEQICASCSAPF